MVKRFSEEAYDVTPAQRRQIEIELRTKIVNFILNRDKFGTFTEEAIGTLQQIADDVEDNF